MLEPHLDGEMKILESFFDTVIQMFREYCFFAKEDGKEIETEQARPLIEKPANSSRISQAAWPTPWMRQT